MLQAVPETASYLCAVSQHLVAPDLDTRDVQHGGHDGCSTRVAPPGLLQRLVAARQVDVADEPDVGDTRDLVHRAQRGRGERVVLRARKKVCLSSLGSRLKIGRLRSRTASLSVSVRPYRNLQGTVWGKGLLRKPLSAYLSYLPTLDPFFSSLRKP